MGKESFIRGNKTPAAPVGYGYLIVFAKSLA